MYSWTERIEDLRKIVEDLTALFENDTIIKLLALTDIYETVSRASGGASVVAPASDHWLWMNDYKQYGEKSYVFRNKDLYKELCSTALAANDANMAPNALAYIIENDGDVGIFFARILGINPSLFDGLRTLQQVIEDEGALDAMLDNEIAFGLIKSSTLIKDAILKNIKSVNILNWNSNYRAYLNTVPTVSPTSSSTASRNVPTYLMNVDTGVKNAQASPKYESACAGASYVDLDGNNVVLRVGHSNGGSTGQVAQSYSVNKIVMSVTSTTGYYNYNNDGTTDRGAVYTKYSYKPLFA